MTVYLWYWVAAQTLFDVAILVAVIRLKRRTTKPHAGRWG